MTFARSRTSPLALPALLACLAFSACGDDEASSAAKDTTAASQSTEADTAAEAGAETQPEEQGASDGATATVEEIESCLQSGGLEPKEEADAPLDGLQGYRKVALGEGQFEDPAADGAFAFFGHVYVFETPAQADEAAGNLLDDRFTSGRVQGNVYTGFNTELDLVPETKGGEAFLTCVQGS